MATLVGAGGSSTRFGQGWIRSKMSSTMQPLLASHCQDPGDAWRLLEPAELESREGTPDCMEVVPSVRVSSEPESLVGGEKARSW